MLHAGITIDACMECRGLWFDATELERVLALPGPVFYASRLQYTDSEPTDHPCPRCHGAMRAQEVQPGGFVYDRCSACGGLWLPLNMIHVLLKELGVSDTAAKQEGERLEAQVEKAQEATEAARQASAVRTRRASRDSVSPLVPGIAEEVAWAPTLEAVRLLALSAQTPSGKESGRRRRDRP
jgi:Zn-finger nucleic acid-binding protein